jgi:hypothetical protein
MPKQGITSANRLAELMTPDQHKRHDRLFAAVKTQADGSGDDLAGDPCTQAQDPLNRRPRRRNSLPFGPFSSEPALRPYGARPDEAEATGK